MKNISNFITVVALSVLGPAPIFFRKRLCVLELGAGSGYDNIIYQQCVRYTYAY